jgi:peroxiredoxin
MRTGIIGIACAWFLAAGCASTSLAPVGRSRQPAPQFQLTALDGKPIELTTLKGKVVVLDFWATWCEPCVQALPHLQAMAVNVDMAQRGLVVLAVNEEETPEIIRPFIDGNHFTFTVVQDTDGSAARDYSAFSLPTTIVIGRDGLVWAVVSGWTQNSAEQIDDAVKQALDAPIR